MSLYKIAHEPQPEYPLLDLTRNNMQALVQEMTDQLFAESGITSRRQAHLALKTTHPVITAEASEVRDGYYIDAIGHGTTLLAAMSASVGGLRPPTTDKLRVSTTAGGLVAAAHSGRIDEEAMHMLQLFEEQMPHTREVVQTSSQRHFGGLTKYALLGAALERQVILDSYE